MRFNKLNLSRYGHFTDFDIDFGDSKKRTPDLHIIYGENEAGKSTTLSAIVDVLYGMMRLTPYNFIHNNKTMEIGATLEQYSQTLELRRFKNQLTGSNNTPLAQSSIDTHGLSREEFQSRFSFDEKTLNEGGEAILGNNGDLGNALFSATSGIANFTAAVDTLLEPANAFYEPGKRRKDKILFEIVDKLKDIDAQRAALDTNASYWLKQEQLAEENRTHYEDFKAKTDKKAALLDELQRKHRALSVATRYKNLQASASDNDKLPTIPPTWLSEANLNIKNQVSLEAKLEQLQGLQQTLEKQKQSLSVDDELIAHTPSIEAQRTQRTLFEQRETDLAQLKQKQHSLSNESSQLRKSIELSGFKTDKFDQLSQTHLNELRSQLSTHGKLKTELDIAQLEHDKLTTELQKLNEKELSQPINTDALSNYVDIVLESANHIKSQQVINLITDLDGDVDALFAKLNPWQGNSDQLSKLSMPSKAHLESLETKLQATENQISVTQDSISNLNVELDQLNEDSDKPGLDSLTISLNDARKNRDEIWQKHIDSIDQEAKYTQLQKTAREYLLTQSALDTATDVELSEADQKAEQKALKTRHKSLQSKINSFKTTLKEHQDEHSAVVENIGDIAQSLNLNKLVSPRELIDWIDLREHVIETVQRRNKLHTELTKLTKTSQAETERLKALTIDIDASTTSLLSSMQDTGEVIALAQTTLQNQQRLNTVLAQHQEAVTSLESQIRSRQTQLTDAKAAFEQWNKQWVALLEGTGIEEQAPESVNAVLDNLQSALDLQANINELDQQIEQIDVAQARFTKSAEELLSNLGRMDTSPLTQRLDKLFKDSHDNEQKHTGLKQLIEREKKLQEDTERAELELAPVAKQINLMLNTCAVTNVADLETTIEKVKESSVVQQKLKEYEQDLKEVLRSDSAADALQALNDVEETSLQSEINELNSDIDYDKQRLADLHHEFRKVQDELDSFKSDATVAQLAQSKQTLTTHLEDQALHTMRLHLGKLAIDQGVRHFREQHRSSMLDNAKKAFTTITCGNYTDLTTQPGKKHNSEELVGIRNTGQSTLAVDMSTGTRAQLYLSLRIAAYQDYCKTREPLPFVADDIMESFDEQRTQATLTLLNDMAKQGQIIYLTHHRHVVELAQDSLGGHVKVHELPRRV